MNLILVRHGETDWNKQRRYQGQLDVPLNSTGLWQAKQAARALSGEPVQRIISSDLARAYVTAEQIAAACGAPIGKDQRWRELNYGDWQGLAFAAIKAGDPQAYARWKADPVRNPPPGGETVDEAARRVRAAWKTIVQTGDAQTVVLVAHGGSLRVLLQQLLGLSSEAFWQFKLANASLSRLQIDGAGATALILNDTSHLENARAAL
jgi:probable phosphoglycerate mutase